MRSTLLVSVLAVSATLVGCRADLSDLRVASVAQVVEWRASGEGLTLCDANSEDTRAKYGVIPGAQLLSSYRDYEVAAELPSDRAAKLVFYCHSEMCGAAGDAARKAVAAGYGNVWVMAPGIAGWAEAGQRVAKSEAGARRS